MKKRPLNVCISLLSAGVTAAVSTLSVFPQMTYAEGNDFKLTDDCFRYTENDDDTITILGRENGDYDKEKLEIPSEIDGKPVTIIGENAFWFSDYSEVVFPDTLIEIGESAFISSDLESVELPDSVKKIGEKAFSECGEITSVKLTPNIEEIGSAAFSSAGSLEYVYIPNMPALNTDDGLAEWFYKCGLKKAELEDGITRLPTYLFSDCEDLTELIWSDDLEVIGNNAFAGCGFTEMIIPESVTEIRDFAFKSCTFTELTLPKGLKIIGNSAFSDCNYVTNIDIPPEVEEIGDTAFGYMDSLEELYVPNIPAVQNNKFYNTLYHSGLKKIQFADDIAVIPEYMCSGCEALEEIVWSDSLEEIGNYGFANCISLKDPKLPEGLKKLGKYAFSYCTGIENVDLPLSIEELGYRPFQRTDSLKYLYVPKQFPSTSGEYAGGSAFMDSGIEKLVFADGITEINDTFSDLPELTEVVIPDSVTKLDHHAFDGCSSLSEINLPKNLKEIEWIGTFGGCENLREIKIPASVEKASYFGSPVLETVEFEEGMTKIPDKFTGSETLRKVIIPDSVTEIGESAFSGCKNLSIIEGANNENLVVSYDAFGNCNNLWDSRFSYFERGGLSFQMSVNGDVENYTVHYSINPKYRDDFESVKFKTFLDTEVTVIEESLVMDNYDIGWMSFECESAEPEGTIRFSIRNPDRHANAAYNPSIEIKTKEGTVNIQPTRDILRNAEINAVLSLTVPDKANKIDGTSRFNVFGKTLLDKEVKIYVDGELYTTVTSSKYTGKFNTEIEYSGDADSVRVKAVWEDVKTDEYIVKFAENEPEIVSVIFGHDNTHYYVHEDITDIFKNGSSPYIPYNPSMPVDFEVKLTTNDNTAAMYMTSETDGERSAIELKYDAASDSWKGEGFFDTAVPGTLNVVRIPEKASGMLVADGDSVKFRGSDHKLTDADYDPETEYFLENTTQKVVYNSENAAIISCDLSPLNNGEPTDEAINIYQGISDSTWIDGQEVSASDIAASAEEYGFVKSDVKYTDENGDVHTYYVKLISDSDEALAIADNIYLDEAEMTDIEVPNGRKNASAGKTLANFLKNSSPLGKIVGAIIVDRNNTSGETDCKSEFINSVKQNIDDNALTGVLNEGLGKAGQAFVTKVTVVQTVVDTGAQVYTDCNNHSIYSDQIKYSKNEYVREHARQLSTANDVLLGAKVFTKVGAGILGIGVAVSGAPILAAVAAGACIAAGAFFIGNLLDYGTDHLKSLIYGGCTVDADGELRYLLDPSGYVYGKNKDDRIEGATATIYYKDENGKAVKWNAEDYDQKNPQITDSAGWYAWDVPEGEWKVVVEKEGYITAESEWLPVLPVQTDVNLQLKTEGGAESSDKYILGDVTGDGIIDATDASFILTAYAVSSIGGDDEMNDEQRKAADVNGDGVIDAIDASTVLTYYARSSVDFKGSFEEYLNEFVLK